MRHKWKWNTNGYGTGVCTRCKLKHSISKVKGPRFGTISRFTYPDGTTVDTNKTPPCKPEK